MEKIVIKRNGNFEEFNDKKLYISIYYSILNCHEDEKTAENIAKEITNAIKEHFIDKTSFSSKDLKDLVEKKLGEKNENFALMYKHHFDIC